MGLWVIGLIINASALKLDIFKFMASIFNFSATLGAQDMFIFVVSHFLFWQQKFGLIQLGS